MYVGRNAERRSGGGATATRAASADGDLGGPDDDRMADVVEAAPAGPTGELGVLPRRQVGPAGAAELAEPFDHDRPGRHVDAERQRLGGEDDLEQPGREAGFDGLAVRRDEPGVVGRDAGLEPFEPLREPEDAEVVVGQAGDVGLGDLADRRPLPRGR